MVSRPIRLASLSLLFAFAVISACVGLNALVKSNQAKAFVKHSSPTGVVVEVGTNDILRTGIVLIAINATLAIITLVSLLTSFSPNKALSRRRNLIEGALILFFTVWIFACMIPYDVFFANQSARVTAFLGGSQLPDSLVQAQEAQIGVSPVYKKQHYLRLVAIIPWFTILFGLISSVILLTARGAHTYPPTTAAVEPDSPISPEAEKANKRSAEVNV